MFVTFYSGESVASKLTSSNAPLTIIQVPSFLPTEQEKIDDKKRFEVSETIGGETAQGNGTTYGLTKMGPKDDKANVSYENKKKEQDKNKNEPFIGKSLAEKELEAFKEDVEDFRSKRRLRRTSRTIETLVRRCWDGLERRRRGRTECEEWKSRSGGICAEDGKIRFRSRYNGCAWCNAEETR